MNRQQRRAAQRDSGPAAASALLAEAVRRQRAGDAEGAERQLRQALKANPPPAELGHALRDMGRRDEAADAFRRAVAAQPNSAEAHNTLGGALMELRRFAEAEASFRRALALRPDFVDPWYNLGNTLAALGRVDDAIAALREAVALRPDLAQAHNNLGGLLLGQGRLEEAEARCRAALAIRADFAEAHNNLGAVLAEQGRVAEAIASYRAALARQAAMPQVHNNLCVAHRKLGHLDESVAAGRQAVALRGSYAEARYNLSLALLARGDFVEGWAEYESRWDTPQLRAGRRDFPQPQWRGEPGGQTLLLHAEQGFGDALQFCRYAPLAAARGLRVIVEAPQPLVRLLAGLGGVAQLLARGEALPPFDLHCPMMSLPLAFGTTLATIPADTPYLHPDPAEAARWRSRLPAGLRVGLAWAGNPRSQSPALAAVDRRRSLAPERLAPLLGVPGVQFVSLQKFGAKAPDSFALFDPMDDMGDFADTAALIAELDLVISVDSAVAHLAGALGKPVWLLDRFDPCWRWLTGRRDSPWYPGLRIYRQPAPGEWDPVLAEVATDLRAYPRG